MRIRAIVALIVCLVAALANASGIVTVYATGLNNPLSVGTCASPEG